MEEAYHSVHGGEDVARFEVLWVACEKRVEVCLHELGDKAYGVVVAAWWHDEVLQEEKVLVLVEVHHQTDLAEKLLWEERV